MEKRKRTHRAIRSLFVARRSHGIAYSIPQACNPKAVAMAVNTVMAIWRIFPHTVFLFPRSFATLRFALDDN